MHKYTYIFALYQMEETEALFLGDVRRKKLAFMELLEKPQKNSVWLQKLLKANIQKDGTIDSGEILKHVEQTETTA